MCACSVGWNAWAVVYRQDKECMHPGLVCRMFVQRRSLDPTLFGDTLTHNHHVVGGTRTTTSLDCCWKRSVRDKVFKACGNDSCGVEKDVAD